MTDDQLAEACKALAHPARIQIMRHLLAEGRCICGRLVETMPLAQSTVSQHLKVMKKAGLIEGNIEGPKTCYCVNKKTLSQLANTVGSLLTDLPGGE